MSWCSIIIFTFSLTYLCRREHNAHCLTADDAFTGFSDNDRRRCRSAAQTSALLVRPSVRPSLCPSVNFLRKSLLLRGKWLDCDQTCIRWSPGERAPKMCSRSRSRSKVTWHGLLCARTKIASSRKQIGSFTSTRAPISAGINDPPKEWRRPRGRSRQTWLRTIENAWPQTSEHGAVRGRPGTELMTVNTEQWREIVETATFRPNRYRLYI